MSVLKSFRFALPFFIFLVIVIFLWRGLSLHPTQVPSPFIDKPAPAFQLSDLFDEKKQITQQDFLGHVTLLNVWATWCYACSEEHEVLVDLAKHEHIIFYGLNYKDDLTEAKRWLKKNGNPYKMIAVDPAGNTAIDWGVYGTPETFIIDKKGIIRYKHIGPLTPDAWENELQPLVKKLEQAS